MLPKSISKLSKALSRVPSIGPKSAEKLAVWFAGQGSGHALELSAHLAGLHKDVGICSLCGYFSEEKKEYCLFCLDSSRESTQLCLVENVLDVIDMEETGAFKGRYFVLGGIISPLEGKTVSDLPFELLKQRVCDENIREIIIALGATTEADVTSMYLKEFFQDTEVKLSVLARGISVGTGIRYAGKKSIIEALRTRENLD